MAPKKLEPGEFEEMKRHTTIGHDILKKCKFKADEISLSALEHHERLDGRGYPRGKTNISQSSQIIGIIDCYEALTNDDRPYRDAMEAFETLHRVIRRDVEEGKFNSKLYSQFVKSLGASKI